MYINNLGHMTKMVAMPIYSKTPSKIFSGTDGLISTKLCHGEASMATEIQCVYINQDPVMTLT